MLTTYIAADFAAECAKVPDEINAALDHVEDALQQQQSQQAVAAGEKARQANESLSGWMDGWIDG